MQSTTFYTKKSIRIGYRGCIFHSLMELRYALSIEDDNWFLREHIPIWYDPKTFLPTSYIRETTKKYTPNFLIRNKANGNAWLVELKPKGFDDDMQISIRTRVAENYIRAQNIDWKFKIIYDDEIILTPDKEEKFRNLRRNISAFNFTRHMEMVDKKFNSNHKSFFKTIPSFKGNMTSFDYVKFVKYGSSAGEVL